MTNVDVNELRRCVQLTEKLLAEAGEAVGPYPAVYRDMSAWHEKKRVAMQRVADRLYVSAGLSRNHGHGYDVAVRMQGIRSSSTSGLGGALRNWITAAKKRLEKEAAS